MHPGFSLIIADIEASVVAKRQMVGILRVDPHLAMVKMKDFRWVGKKMEHIPTN